MLNLNQEPIRYGYHKHTADTVKQPTETASTGEETLRSSDWVGEPERTHDVTQRTRWEVRSRKPGEEWHPAGTTVQRDEVDAFISRGIREGFEVQVWWVVATVRTETVKRLEASSPTAQAERP